MTDSLPSMSVFPLLDESSMSDFSHLFVVSPDDDASFESMGFDADDGRRFWWQSDLMAFLGYENKPAFQKAVGKAMSAVATLGLDTAEGFRPAKRLVEEVEVSDVQLSRFACYLTAINGDPNKQEVAAAQA